MKRVQSSSPMTNSTTSQNDSTESRLKSDKNDAATAASVSSSHTPTSQIKIIDDQVYRHNQQRRDQVKLVVEICTLVVVFLYTTFAWQQWQTAEKTLKLQQRAYLLLARDGVEILGERVGQPMAVNVRFQNYGQSPATEITYLAEIKIGPNAMKHIRRIEIPANTTEPSYAVLPPGETVFFNVSADTLIHGALPEFVVFGTVVYKDIFGDRHETDFCVRKPGEEYSWGMCPSYDRIK